MITRWLAALMITGAMTMVVVAGGCQKSLSPADGTAVDGRTAEGDAAPVAVASGPDAPIRAGALLWSQNCARCHNLRNPMERSDREWDIIVHHMRVRGNLTTEEHRLILAFLQSSN